MSATREERDKTASAPPAPRGSSPTPPQLPRFRPSRGWILFALALLAFNFYVSSRATQPPSRVRVPYSPFFLQQVSAGHVKEITSKGTAIQGTFTRKLRYAGSKPTTRFRTEIPAFADNVALSRLLQKKGVVVNAQPLDTGAPWWQNLLLGFGPTILFVFLLFWLMRRAGNVQNVLGSFGRSRARRYQPSGDRVTFADVAGIDEAKAELTEVVDFLRHPEKYRRLGGRIPHGVLLSGPPGTGKTLLARAVAGEADVPFFSLAASEFVEAIVGVGASRVRDLFAQAKEAAPALVFIDELDAVGRARFAGIGGGHDEREQTLNQLLIELDGFEQNQGIILIAATNRPDVIDTALLRPGRFDRQINVPVPDCKGREAILKVHAQIVKMAPNADLAVVARRTPGFAGADLANVINEGALLAARKNKEMVELSDLEEAIERVMAGPQKRSNIMSEREKKIVSYHECGHTLVAKMLPGTDPVHKVSILSRGFALGYTLQLPLEDKYLTSRADITNRLAILLGGRAAEELAFNEITTGAADDLSKATAYATRMVTEFGMSDAVGPLSLKKPDQEMFMGRDLNKSGGFSERTMQLVDEEVKRLVTEAQVKAREILNSNKKALDQLAQSLFDREVLSGDDVDNILAAARA